MKRRQFIVWSLLVAGGCKIAGQNLDFPTAKRYPPQLKFAVTDVLELEKLEKSYGPFRAKLEEVLKTKVEFFPVNNMAAAASALQLNQVDLVLTGPSEYVVIRSRTNATPVIAITRPNYHSVIVTPADSPIKSLTALKNKSIALSDVGSTSGHLGPTKMLIDAGLNPQSDVKILMLGDEGSIEAIQQGKVDAWGGSALDYQQFLNSSTNTQSQFSIIAEGPPLPSDIFVAGSQLSSETVEQIRSEIVKNQDILIQALVTAEETKKYQGSQLVAANDNDYNMIREVYKAIGQGKFIQ
jgi:phosphonate transport system substrate-binding protein